MLNTLIHRQLQQDGKVSREDHQMMVFVNRQDMTGTERTFANSYVPDEDIIRYNRVSKVYGFNVGDYARVTATNHEKNELTVLSADGREITYNPARLSGVNVYRESNRTFSEGDRIQFRAPFTEQRVVNGELGTIKGIKDEEYLVALDDGRAVSFESDKFRHIDHGYAVTSYSSQSQTVDRVLVNADAKESDLLLNQRMGYVAISRAREDAIIFTNSADQLRAALDRSVDKEMAVEALRQSSARDALSRDWERIVSPTSRGEVAEQSFDQGPTTSDEDGNGDQRTAGEEIKLELSQ